MKQTIGVRMLPSMRSKIKAIARDSKRDFSDMVRLLLDEAIEAREKSKPKKGDV